MTGENELIQYIREHLKPACMPWLEVGPGDDAAVISIPEGRKTVLTTDMLIEGTHYKSGTPAKLIGHKAAARTLSDLAAMASEPLATLMNISIPSGVDQTFVKNIIDSFSETAESLSAPLIGGDISSGTGKMVIAVSAIGTTGETAGVLRSGAKPDDYICVTGALGGAIDSGRHLRFTPRIAEAGELVKKTKVHAMIDISDGLSTEIAHICAESHVGAVIQQKAIPIHDDARTAVTTPDMQKTALEHALNDGEDYELLFCLAETDMRKICKDGLCKTPVTAIGRITAKKGIFLELPDNSRKPLEARGWEHKIWNTQKLSD
jgi:thiamine-monophosphate kinase